MPNFAQVASAVSHVDFSQSANVDKYRVAVQLATEWSQELTLITLGGDTSTALGDGKFLELFFKIFLEQILPIILKLLFPTP